MPHRVAIGSPSAGPDPGLDLVPLRQRLIMSGRWHCVVRGARLRCWAMRVTKPSGMQLVWAPLVSFRGVGRRHPSRLSVPGSGCGCRTAPSGSSWVAGCCRLGHPTAIAPRCQGQRGAVVVVDLGAPLDAAHGGDAMVRNRSGQRETGARPPHDAGAAAAGALVVDFARGGEGPASIVFWLAKQDWRRGVQRLPCHPGQAGPASASAWGRKGFIRRCPSWRRLSRPSRAPTRLTPVPAACAKAHRSQPLRHAHHGPMEHVQGPGLAVLSASAGRVPQPSPLRRARQPLRLALR